MMIDELYFGRTQGFSTKTNNACIVHKVHPAHEVHALCPSAHWPIGRHRQEPGQYGHYGLYGQRTNTWYSN